MEIILENIGRRFNQDWIFQGINYRFVQGESYAILGPNGSGKSTLLQVILSSLSPSKGKISYINGEDEIDVEQLFPHMALATPYLELIEEFTLRETIDFHFAFKKLWKGMTTDKLVELLGLHQALDREIRYFSSGMKQRTKLALACCADTPLLFLDEPTANLDEKGVAWYQELIRVYGLSRLLVVCSNQPHEYAFCKYRLLVEDYK
ncbi:ABC transporter ATP-binding protein [Olivibacter sp. SDN3]|uniref:ABC transporter ATP-binding protein n=1 Tax=Olivibacter sp. SDN3 TaxID=2764720 RepID=UPI0016515471|nr:ABC transporter ATP-binding protein [Olivibacter sp. SDN3]QNL51338.1 ABC transporter ATP-binding protein [Olivibacter sp. SDN3]